MVGVLLPGCWTRGIAGLTVAARWVPFRSLGVGPGFGPGLFLLLDFPPALFCGPGFSSRPVGGLVVLFRRWASSRPPPSFGFGGWFYFPAPGGLCFCCYLIFKPR